MVSARGAAPAGRLGAEAGVETGLAAGLAAVAVEKGASEAAAGREDRGGEMCCMARSGSVMIPTRIRRAEMAEPMICTSGARSFCECAHASSLIRNMLHVRRRCISAWTASGSASGELVPPTVPSINSSCMRVALNWQSKASCIAGAACSVRNVLPSNSTICSTK